MKNYILSSLLVLGVYSVKAQDVVASVNGKKITLPTGGVQPLITGSAKTIDTEQLTAGKVVVTDASGDITESSVTTTTLDFLDATSSVQGQLDAKGIGSVTLVSATVNTLGSDVAVAVATDTTTPAITISLPNASATTRGVISAADWNTFNDKGNSFTEIVDQFTVASAGQTVFTLTATPSTSSVLVMICNGVELANGSVTFAGTDATYVPGSNGNYSLVIGDVIKFRYIK
ncbi:hypothetical protein CLU81_0571 [Flavobacterium sp. 9]|uniref:hypothetical protein n=1 Tax=Flavobacterium sp. 9 TaxID=2035198 RepID=UPI000C18EF28|nr:hypothetical protein [Flavobacterium sp. 9]PIF30164.1 hypothetical protein CLU81_0571 [Flavobacterium sp. 9]